MSAIQIEPIALSPRQAAQFLAVSKSTITRLIRSKKLAARKLGIRTLIDVSSLKALYAALPEKTDHLPLVFGERAHVRPKSRPRKKTRH